MMSKNYAKSLSSACKRHAEKHDIFDIVLYGSATTGKREARDVDLMLLFKSEALKGRAEIAQGLKEALAGTVENLDVKTLNLPDLFASDFLARQALLVEGYSLLHDAPFSELLGFKGRVMFTYSLKNLNHNKKTRFTYALSGRHGEGIREKLSIESLGRGAVLVPVENSSVFESFLLQWDVTYEKKKVLVSLL